MKSSYQAKVKVSLLAAMRLLEDTNLLRVFLQPSLEYSVRKLEVVYQGNIPEAAAAYMGYLIGHGVFDTEHNTIDVYENPIQLSEYHHGGFAIAEGWLAVSATGELLFRPRRRHTLRFGVSKGQWMPVAPKKEEWLMTLLSPQQKSRLAEVQQKYRENKGDLK